MKKFYWTLTMEDLYAIRSLTIPAMPNTYGLAPSIVEKSFTLEEVGQLDIVLDRYRSTKYWPRVVSFSELAMLRDRVIANFENLKRISDGTKNIPVTINIEQHDDNIV